MRPLSTVILLREWGRWGSLSMGYPRMSPMFGERALKMPLHGVGYIPPDVLDIEHALQYVEPGERRIIIHRYQWFMSFAEIGRLWFVSKWVARNRVEEAEASVHSAYCHLSTIRVNQPTVEKVSLKPA